MCYRLLFTFASDNSCSQQQSASAFTPQVLSTPVVWRQTCSVVDYSCCLTRRWTGACNRVVNTHRSAITLQPLSTVVNIVRPLALVVNSHCQLLMILLDIQRHFSYFKSKGHNKGNTMPMKGLKAKLSVHSIEKCWDMFICHILQIVYLHCFTQLRRQHMLALNTSNTT